MDIKQYSDAIERFAVYPGSGTGSPEAIAYCALGLNGELGEYATTNNVEDGIKEAGDVLWYLTRLQVEIAIAERGVPNFQSTGVALSVPMELATATTLHRNAAVIAEWAKKRMRDGKAVTPELFQSITQLQDGIELGLSFTRTTMGEAMKLNVEKLTSRLNRGVINGDGDNR